MSFTQEVCTANPPSFTQLGCIPPGGGDQGGPGGEPDTDGYGWIATDGWYRIVEHGGATHNWDSARGDGYLDLQPLPTSHRVNLYV